MEEHKEQGHPTLNEPQADMMGPLPPPAQAPPAPPAPAAKRQIIITLEDNGNYSISSTPGIDPRAIPLMLEDCRDLVYNQVRMKVPKP